MSVHPPLAGVTVVEITANVAGPYAGKILAELGADVIKVEPPEGETSRGWKRYVLGDATATFQAFNKEKRSVVCKLSDADDVAKLNRLIDARADVVVQNLRPGLAEKYGFGAADAVKRKPELVYCDMGAFGGRGPMKDLPGYDPLVQGFSGITSVTGEAGRPPSRVGVPIIDMGTGMWAALGIVAALHRRHETGQGGVVEASLFDTGLAWMTMAFASYEATGEVPERRGLSGPLVAPNGAFEAKDGLLLITTASESLFVRLCEAIDLPALVDDPRFASGARRYDNDTALAEAINARLRTATRAEWAARLAAAGVPNAPIQTLDEVEVHPQTAASELIQKSPDGAYRLIGLPLRFDGERPAFRKAAPALGEADAEMFGIGG